MGRVFAHDDMPRSAVFAKGATAAVPQYEVDPSWPPKLPNNWIWGVPTWVNVDRRGHVWVVGSDRSR